MNSFDDHLLTRAQADDPLAVRMNTATATVYQLPVREPLHLVHLETGELLTDGEESLNELADQVSALLDRQVRDAWELGRLVALARLRCEDKDCGIAGDNPDARFGKWVSLNFKETGWQTINTCPPGCGLSTSSKNSTTR